VDLVTTYLFVSSTSHLAEANPLMQNLMTLVGVPGALFVNGVLAAITFWFVYRVDKLRLWVIVSIILGLAALWNTLCVLFWM